MIALTQATAGASCSVTQVNIAQSLLNNVTDSLSNTTGIGLGNLRDALWTSSFLTMSDAYQNCDNFLRSMLTSYTIQETYESTGCFSTAGSAEWEADPCCNPFYTWSSIACLPRNVTVNLVKLNTTIESSLGNCSSFNKTIQTLNDFAVLVNNAEDPSQG